MKTKSLLGFLLLGVLAAPVAAGDRVDALRSAIDERLAELRSQAVLDEKAKANVAKADGLLTEARNGLATIDATNGKAALKSLGKAVRALEKAAKKEGNPDFVAFVTQTGESLWGASAFVFVGDAVFIPGSEEEERLYNRVGEKLGKPFKLASKKKFAKAIGKLAKVWSTLLQLFPDP